MKTYNIDYFFPEDAIYQLSIESEKPVIYFRADGPRSCEDKSKQDEVWDFYYGKCDTTIMSALQQKGEVYCYFMTLESAYQAFQEWFAQQSDLTEEESHFYIHCHFVSAKDNIDIVNGI